MAKGPKLTRKGEASRKAIMNAAAALFADKGIGAVSIGDIAEAARVNRAMISYYFGSKGGLYDAIIDEAVGEAATALEQADPAVEPDPLRQLIMIFADVLGRRPHLVPMILHDYFQPGRLFEPRTAGKLAGFMGLTEKVLRTAPLHPEAKRYDPQVVHLIAVGAINYFILTEPFRRRLTGKLDREITTPELDEFASTLADIFSRGLRI